jgi:predicted NUDIX family phosphoesterase
MNEPVLEQMLSTTRQTAERLNRAFRIFQVDTSGSNPDGPRKTAEEVASIVLDLIEEQLEEEILFLPAADVTGLFAGLSAIGAREAESLVAVFAERGQFQSRDTVEANESLVQALPVVVVRNRNGQVLRLRRREQRTEDLLHQKVVIWAGGHVRREDGTNGSSILRGAVRELQEELRLSIDPGRLRLLGAIHLHNEVRTHTRKHAAIVYEWRAEFDDVAVALSSVEFFERRGNSVSGSFVSIEELAKDVDAGTISEPWSTEIVRHMLPEVNGLLSTKLL